MRNYKGALKQYEDWCQHERVPALDAYPITWVKAVLFVDYGMKGPKKRSGTGKRKKERTEEGAEDVGKATIPGTTVGLQTVQLALSALEHYRKFTSIHFSREQYPQAHEPIRFQPSIQEIVKAAKRSQVDQQTNSMEIKSAGRAAETYTAE